MTYVIVIKHANSEGEGNHGGDQDKQNDTQTVEEPAAGYFFWGQSYHLPSLLFWVRSTLNSPFIAITPNGSDVLGIRGIIFNFYPKSADIDVDDLNVAEIGLAPYGREDTGSL